VTLEEIQKRVEEIRAVADDDESAHVLEDRLRRDVLSAIAEGFYDDAGARQAAAAVLSTKEIRFARWCA
jgi:hypothetical protein